MAVIDVSDTYQLTNVGAHIDNTDVINSNQNLLDNWVLYGGGSNFPINQRGVSGTVSTSGYFIDRWQLVSGSVTLNSAYITLGANSGIRQCGPNWLISSNATYTLSAMVDYTVYTVTGTLSTSESGWQIAQTLIPNVLWVGVQFADNKWDFRFTTTNGVNLRMVKLERGNFSTLANDLPPQRDMELAKCKAYFERIKAAGSYTVFGTGQVISTTGAYIQVPMSPKRNTSYTISTHGSFRLVSASNQSVTGLSLINQSTNALMVQAAVSSGLTNGNACLLQANNDSTAYIDVSADL